jgi:hypothetical protein
MAKPLTIQQQAFLKSDVGIKARIQLKLMVNDPSYNTRETYSSTSPSNTLFVDKHMVYLSEHPKLNAQHYLSNLRLMTRIKR